jgi:hypothetical protein
MTKILQGRLNALNPHGIIDANQYCRTFNVHDEIVCTGDWFTETKKVVEDFVVEYKDRVPFLKMKWNKINNWSEND